MHTHRISKSVEQLASVVNGSGEYRLTAQVGSVRTKLHTHDLSAPRPGRLRYF